MALCGFFLWSESEVFAFVFAFVRRSCKARHKGSAIGRGRVARRGEGRGVRGRGEGVGQGGKGRGEGALR